MTNVELKEIEEAIVYAQRTVGIFHRSIDRAWRMNVTEAERRLQSARLIIAKNQRGRVKAPTL